MRYKLKNKTKKHKSNKDYKLEYYKDQFIDKWAKFANAISFSFEKRV